MATGCLKTDPGTPTTREVPVHSNLPGEASTTEEVEPARETVYNGAWVNLVYGPGYGDNPTGQAANEYYPSYYLRPQQH